MSVLKLMNLKEEMIIKVVNDSDSESPREWENLGTFYTWQNNYFSPDSNGFRNGVDFISSILGEDLTNRLHSQNTNTNDFMNDVMPRLDKKGIVLFPVSKYEHGDVQYSLGAFSGWDTGTVGVIFAEKKKIYEWLNVKKMSESVREKVERNFSGELEDYTKWCNGEVYGFEVTDLIGNHIDSCYGFYDNMYDKEVTLEIVSSHSNIGSIDNWELYDNEKFNEVFTVETVLVRK